MVPNEKVAEKSKRTIEKAAGARNAARTNRSLGMACEGQLISARTKQEAGDRENTIRYALQQFTETLHDNRDKYRDGVVSSQDTGTQNSVKNVFVIANNFTSE